MLLPPLPTWDSLHPLVIHFPIALLMTAPIFVVLGLAIPRIGKWFHWSALLLMVLGTVGAWVAVATGEAAGELAQRTPAISEVLERHEELAEMTRTFFTILTLGFAAFLIVPLVRKKDFSCKVSMAVVLPFLLLYGGAMLSLVNTAHNGGLLVHEYGVHAMLPLEAHHSESD